MEGKVSMKNTLSICWLLILGASMLACATDLSLVPNSTSKEGAFTYLTTVAPKEMKEFRFAAVKAAFKIVDRTRKIALTCHQDAHGTPLNRAKSEAAYRYAWYLVETLYQQTADNEVRKFIIDRWDASVAAKIEPNYLLKQQIASLLLGWNHDYLTPTLCTRFLETNDQILIEEFCGILVEFGENRDLPVLKLKLAAVRLHQNTDKKLQKNIIQAIQYAIATIERGPIGSPSRIGPATPLDNRKLLFQ